MAEDMFAELLRQTQREYDALDMPLVCEEAEVEEIDLPMSDGIRLKTYIYRPCIKKSAAKDLSYPVILQRSPYFHGMDSYRLHGRNLARRGFVYIIQSCRGTGESGGEWTPNINERRDGLETLEWLQGEAWVRNVGYWGDSYLALTGWCMADKVPDKVKGMYLGVYGTDRFTSAYCKGAFRHDVLTSWAMENAGFPVTADYEESCRYRPQIEVDEKLWGKKIPWYRDWITAVEETDPYWQQGFWKMLRDIPEKVQIPLLITEGWYDHHLGSALKSYEMLNDSVRGKSTLRVGCWNHFSMNCLEWGTPRNLENSEVKSMTDWFRTLLVEDRIPEKKAQIYIIGRDEWRELDAWPMPVGECKKYYLNTEKYAEKQREGTLELQKENCSGECSYLYDPENPTRSLGAEAMLKSIEKVGSRYQPPIGERADVLSFVSDIVEDSFVIGGKIRVSLQVSSDCEDTAFTAKLMEVDKDGRTVNIRSSITTIAADHPGDAYVPGTPTEVVVEMWDIAWEVQKGSRLRLDISSSDFPQYSIHSNYAGLWSKQDKSRTAKQTIYCNGAGSSYIELPILQESMATVE
ncbi:MAG: CocE/NonD family hydrolase [Eubacteriales bacterium]|nr:CocE/NonD family hydrolase [Eubacteriales bacterium]